MTGQVITADVVRTQRGHARWLREIYHPKHVTADFAVPVGMFRATSYHYRNEVLFVPSGHALDLTETAERVEAEGSSHVIPDGKIVDFGLWAQKRQHGGVCRVPQPVGAAGIADIVVDCVGLFVTT
ncbi:hypothetical protein [Phytohabitans kaempferiae]|uniref:Uncharacterized protein n=1 Tax=Phytohabitans kaempferiae TaxID=1620943 RepID=A0ABV6LXF6_9ACTN